MVAPSMRGMNTASRLRGGCRTYFGSTSATACVMLEDDKAP
jgi:hypothetical protein